MQAIISKGTFGNGSIPIACITALAIDIGNENMAGRYGAMDTLRFI